MAYYAFNNLANNITQIDINSRVPAGVYGAGEAYYKFFIAPTCAQMRRRYFFEEDNPWLQLMNEVVPHDIIYTSSLTNIALDLIKVLTVIADLDQRGIRVIAFKEEFDSDSDEAKALFYSLPLMEKFRRSASAAKRSSRQAGIQRAAKEGKYKGRQSYNIEDFPDFRKLYSLYMQREISKGEFANLLSVSRPTLNRLLDEFLTQKRSD